MVFLAVELNPELPPLPLPPLVKEAGSTLVVTGTALLPVLVTCRVLPPLTLVIVVTTSEKDSVVINVLDADDVLGVVDGAAELSSLVCEEVEGVNVDVVSTMTVDVVELALLVMVDVSSVTEAEVDVGVVDGLVLLGVVSLAVEEDGLEESLPPVDNGTL